MSTYTTVVANLPTYNIPQNLFDTVLVYSDCNIIVLPPISGTVDGFHITIINYDLSNKTILNGTINITIFPKQTITFSKNIDNSSFWSITQYSTVISNYNPSDSGWVQDGNMFSNAVLGTTNSNTWNIIYNGITIATIGPSTITGLPTPSNNTDVVIKSYVDNAIANVTSNAWEGVGNTFVNGKLGTTTPNTWNLLYNGATIATIGPSTITGLPTPSNNTDVVIKSYVDTNVATLNASITTAVTSLWSNSGNSFNNAKLGTTTPNTWNLLYNGITIATIGPTTITGLPTPSNNTDVVIKSYVDTGIANATTTLNTAITTAVTPLWSNSGNAFGNAKLGTTTPNTWLLLYNGTTIATVGPTTITGLPTPSSNTDVAIKSYVDSNVTPLWSNSGNTFSNAKLGTTTPNTWNLLYNNVAIATVGPSTITGVPFPINNTDIANKSYVDIGITNLNSAISVAITPLWSNAGNAFGSGTKLGTTTPNTWILLYNNATIATVGPSTITGLPTPSNNTDVAIKSYVDTGIAAAATTLNNTITNTASILWSNSGNTFIGGKLGTITPNTWNILYNGTTIATVGPSTLTGLPTPTTNTDVAIKSYVDTGITNATATLNTAITTAVTPLWSNSGNTFSNAKLGTTTPNTWNLLYNNATIATVGPNTITGLPTPTNNSDVAIKSYVDNIITGGNLWNLSGNTGTAGNAKLGTIDNNSFNIIANNAIQMTISNGNINMPQSEYMSFGNTSSDYSTICIKQTTQLNNTGATSHGGIKFINTGTADAFYIGYAFGGTFSIFSQAAAGTIGRVVNVGAIGYASQFVYGIDNQNNTLINVATPINTTDAANKGYVDSSIANLWNIAGNTGTAGNAKLGTTDNNSFNIIANNVTQMTISNGTINMPQSEYMSFGNTGSDYSTFCIKQTAQLNNSLSSSHAGIKFINISTTDAWYFGYSYGGNFSFFQQLSSGTCGRVLDLGSIGGYATFYYGLSVANNNIINVATPINTTDATNKSYVDTSITTAVTSLWSNSGNTFSNAKLGTTTPNTWNLLYNNATIATMGPSTITGLPTPSNNTDVAIKSYVDTGIANATTTLNTAITTAVTSLWSNSGNTFSNAKLGTTTPNTWNLLYNNATIATVGPSTITGLPTPSNNTDVAIKSYVDTGITNATTTLNTAITTAVTPLWSNSGNTFSNAKLGTTTPNTWNLLYNNVAIATVGPNTITGITTPTANTDVANLAFVNSKKCPSVLVPFLNSNNSNSGYIVTASSTLGGNAPYNAINASGDWATNGVTTNYWIQVQLIQSSAIYMVALQGRTSAGGFPATWNLQGSKDGSTWTTLINSAVTLTNTGVQTFQNVISTTIYLYYRFNGLTSSSGATNPGLSCFQLYPYVI